MAESVLVMININRSEQLLCSLLVVNELALRDDTGIQYLVSFYERVNGPCEDLFSSFCQTLEKLSKYVH